MGYHSQNHRKFSTISFGVLCSGLQQLTAMILQLKLKINSHATVQRYTGIQMHATYKSPCKRIRVKNLFATSDWNAVILQTTIDVTNGRSSLYTAGKQSKAGLNTAWKQIIQCALDTRTQLINGPIKVREASLSKHHGLD
jgi:hypothetical protein